METKALKPYLVVIGLMVLTSLVLAFTVDVRVSDEAGIRMALPDRVGKWQGQELRFCQNPACMKELRVSELQDRNVCPVCGSELDSMTRDEKALLPVDTQILKKVYVDPDSRRTLFVSIVLSGKERSSIHRPQVCLVGQGHKILKSHVVPVDIPNRKPLEVMALDLLRPVRTPDGRPFELPSYYAYWFVGKGRETPYHGQRMIWMTMDLILRNVAHRWAYISVSGVRDKDTGAYEEQLQAFLRELYPEMAIR